MKKFYFLIILALILGLVLSGCLLSNVGQVPTTEQSGIAYLTKGPAPSLVGLWHFDEGIGTTANDSSGNGNHGTLTNMDTPTNCWVLGKFGNALSFDGTGDYVQIANESNFDFESTDALTLEAWVKTSSDAILNIITKMSNTPPYTGYQLIKHSSTYGNKLYFFLINNYGTGNMIRAYGSTDIVDDQWHHIAVTYDGSSDVSGVQIYVDGIAETMGSTHNSLTDSILNDLSLQISGREGSNYAFSGLIDEVRIWDKALTIEQLGSGSVIVAMDIKPQSCPNPLNVKNQGVLPVAILGTADFDASEVDPTTVELVGVQPIRWNLEDVATPFVLSTGGLELCLNCTEEGADGFFDLILKFEAQEVLGALSFGTMALVDESEIILSNDRVCLVITLTGNLHDGTPIWGKDTVLIIEKKK